MPDPDPMAVDTPIVADGSNVVTMTPNEDKAAREALRHYIAVARDMGHTAVSENAQTVLDDAMAIAEPPQIMDEE